MFIRNGKRFNIYATHRIGDVVYPAGTFLNPDSRRLLGIDEIPDPYRAPEETHFVQEIDEYPYVINTAKPKEMLDAFNDSKVIAEIATIEATQMRALREAVLTGDLTRLQAIDDQIKGIRKKLAK